MNNIIIYIFGLIAISSFFIVLKSNFQVKKYLKESSFLHIFLVYALPIGLLTALFNIINYQNKIDIEKKIKEDKIIESLSENKIIEYTKPENCSVVLGEIYLVLKNKKSNTSNKSGSITYYYKYILEGEEFSSHFSVKSDNQVYYENNKVYIWHSIIEPSLHQIVFVENDPFPMSIKGLYDYTDYNLILPDKIYEDLQNAMQSGH